MRNHTFVSLGSETIFILLLAFFCSFSVKSSAQNCINQTISFPPDDCSISVTAFDFLDMPGMGSYYLSLVDMNGDTLNNTTFTSVHVGQDFEAHIYDIASGMNCIAQVAVRDQTAPMMFCQDTTISCTISPTPANTGIPVLFDNCDLTAQITGFSDLNAPQNCSSPYVQTILRTFTSIDAASNPGFCIQTIHLRRPALAEVQAPRDTTIACSADSDPNQIGAPTLDGIAIPTGACNIGVSYMDRDTVFTCSQSEYRFTRRWSLEDSCTNVLRTFDQIITVEDPIAPSLNCLPAVTFKTDIDSCNTDISLLPILAQLTMPNNCADSFELHYSWAFGTDSVGPYNNVPIGVYDLTYTYSDCAGADTCTTQIIVEDTQVPTALCKSARVVALSAGTMDIPAAYFDAGSYANCAGVNFRVSRPGQPFSDSVVFECADVGATIMVTLRVRENGNPSQFNDCMVSVSVQDKLAPTITCPANVTVDCLYDYMNPDALGYPTISDNCGVQDTTFSIDEQVTACGSGTAHRTYTATDIHGNESSCRQRVFVENTQLFSGDSILWPLNYQTYSPAGILIPDSLPTANAFPTWGYAGCSIIGLSYQDELLDVAAPACFKILRRWTVVDWCQHDINDPNSPGKWQYYQTIQVFDPTAPDLTVPADLTVSPNAGCSAPFVTLNDATAFDLSPDLRITNNSPYADAGFENASGTYPIGEHIVTFRATDGCGNITVKTTKITVKDVKAPTPLCHNGLTGNLTQMHDGYYLEMPAHLFDAGSSDNCTPTADLDVTIRFSGDTLLPDDLIRFDCDTKGFQPVEVYVTDNQGNSAYCETYIIVQDNMNMCPPDSTNMLRVAGCVVTKSGKKVQGVDIHIANLTNVFPVQTDQAGNYLLDNLPYNGSYKLEPSNDNFPTNGINSLDILTIQKHLLGTEALDSPYKLIAADVNNSNSISPMDIIELRKLILGISSSIPNNESWRFVDGNYTFPNPSNPWIEAFPEIKDFQNLHNNKNNADFYGIKIGDIDGTALTNTNSANDDRTGGAEYSITLPSMDMEAGEAYVFPVSGKVAKALKSFQMTLGFDLNKVEFVNWSAGSLSDMATNESLTQEGLFPVLWTDTDVVAMTADTPLFFIKIKAKVNTHSTTAFYLENYPTVDLAIDDMEQKSNIQLDFESTDNQSVSSKNMLLGVQPNPFTTQTQIRVQMETAGQGLLEVFDATGRVIFSEKKALQKGLNEVPFYGRHLSTAGLYAYRISVGDWTASGRFVKQ